MWPRQMLANEEPPAPSKRRLRATFIEVAATEVRNGCYFNVLDQAVRWRHLGDAAGGR